MVTGYTGEGTDCYYLILGNKGRVDNMMDQLVERLQEAVRSTPIPVTRYHFKHTEIWREESSLIRSSF